MPNSGAYALGVISTKVRSKANPIASLALSLRILRTHPPPVNNHPVVPTEVESLP